MARNVSASYAGYLVFIVFGFVLPRVIDSNVGQAGLGVWDLAWAFVSYLSLSMVGIGSSVNRFVAKHRAAGDVSALGRLVSTVVAIQLMIAALVLLCSVLLFISVPIFYSEQLGQLASTAGWVVGFLGASLAVQMAFDAWRGVLSGCHRWDYYNAINAGGYALSAVVMIIVLSMGGGLEGIAATYLIITTGTELVRFFVARSVCPELVLSKSSVNRADAKVAIRFGVKTMLLAAPAIVVIQTVGLFIVGALGPAALAVLARPLALISHISTLINKYSFILTPVAASLQEGDDRESFNEFSLVHARAGWIVAIPPLVFLLLFGDVVMELWMGPDYSAWKITALLSIGYILPVSQSPILRILVGMDRHGSVAKTNILIAGAVLCIGIVAGSYLGWSLELAAGLIAVSVGLGTGLVVLVHGFIVLGWSMKLYFQRVVLDAIKFMAFLAIPLSALRVLMVGQHAGVLLLAAAGLTALIFLAVQRRDVSTMLRSLRATPGA